MCASAIQLPRPHWHGGPTARPNSDWRLATKLEGRFVNRDALARCSRPIDRDHIEATGTIDQLVARHVVERHPREATLLRPADGFRGGPISFADPSLHFDEDRRLAVARDDVDFAMPRAVAAGKNCVPSPLERGDGNILSCFSKTEALECHSWLSEPRIAPR